jgi:hypothetical protein
LDQQAKTEALDSTCAVLAGTMIKACLTLDELGEIAEAVSVSLPGSASERRADAQRPDGGLDAGASAPAPTLERGSEKSETMLERGSKKAPPPWVPIASRLRLGTDFHGQG